MPNLVSLFFILIGAWVVGKMLGAGMGTRSCRKYPENLRDWIGEQASLDASLQPATISPFSIPDSSIDGALRFGIAEGGIPAGINPEQHINILVTGDPGTGKSAVVNRIIAPQAMALGIKCWFFVKARDTEKLIKFNKDIVTFDFNEQLKINPLQPPPNVTRAEWHSMLWDMFIQAEAIYDGTKNFLIEQACELSDEYEKIGAIPSLFELHDYIKEKEFPRGSRSFSYKESALNRMTGILKGPLSNALDCSSGCLEELANENVIFYIGGLPATQQVFIVNMLIGWLFSYKRDNPCQGRHFLIIDDAMLIFDASFEKRPDRGMPVINHFLAEARKSEINMFANAQFPSLLGQGIFGTSSTKLTFEHSDSGDSGRMLDSMGEHDREKRKFAGRLSKENMEMIVKFSSRYTEPFFAYVPFLEVIRELDEIIVTDEEKRKNNEAKPYLFQSIKPRRPLQQEKEADAEKEDEILKISKDILNDIYNRPFINSTDRAYDFKLSNEKSKIIYRHIENEGFAEPILLNLSGRGGQSKFYWLTDKGCMFIKKQKKPEGSGGKGALHVFIQQFLHEELRKEGYERVEIEKDIGEKKVDLFCIREGRSIGIEICISTFSTEYVNALKDLGRCDRIVIICIDGDAKRKLLEKLGKLKEIAEVYSLCEFLKAFRK